MRDISIEKIVCNIGCGSTVTVDNAKTILDRITNKKSIIIKTVRRNTFGIPKGKPIGCKVTIRDDADKFMKRLLSSRDNKIKESSFDDKGNFSFGVKEYIEIEGMDYDPSIGIIGLDVCVTLKRPGFSVKRKAKPHKIGKKHEITKNDALEFVKNTFNVELI